MSGRRQSPRERFIEPDAKGLNPTRFGCPPRTLPIQSARTGTDRLQSGVFEKADTAQIQAIRLFPATFGSGQLAGNTAFPRAAIVYLIAGTVLIVALPVLALLATVARLSAAVRDRRLANLRLLGMSASQTRLVAATEVGLVSLVGTACGAILHLVCVATVPAGAIAPPAAWLVVVVAVPTLVMLISLLPQRASARGALEDSRRALPDPPGWWRLAPLAAGLALCWWAKVQIGPHGDREVTQALLLSSLFGGVALLGIGVLSVVPVFTRMLAGAVLALGRGPRATLLGRRLQDQPAAMTRVIATLMVGLFAVMMARAVLSAFLATPQYVSAADHVGRTKLPNSWSR